MGDLARAIDLAATAKIRAHERRRKRAHDETVRRARRTTSTLPPLSAQRPKLWDFDPGYEPFHVRACADVIGHAIDAAIQARRYAPIPPAGFEVPKASGRPRAVTAFAIADEVISRRLYRSLFEKNRARLSPRSYAYRNDLGIHDAIAHIQSEWLDEHRLFVAQYDFSDYFGSIDHDHLWSTIASLNLAITRTERTLVAAFLTAPLPTTVSLGRPATPLPRDRGVPQGTTISLLLANISATPLDREFERLGVSFTRYADDIVIWSRDYSALNRAVDELHRFAERSRCTINQEKSLGVQLLVGPDAREAEFRTTQRVEFLSHSIGLRRVSLSDRALGAAKTTVETYIYNHLLREPARGTQNLGRLSGNLDRDYVALIWQLRRFLYGNVSEEQMRRLLRGPLPPKIHLGGLLGRHPLVNDIEQLADFDAWQSTQVWLALRKRAHLLTPHFALHPEPWDRSQAALRGFITRSTRSKLPVDVRMPSAVRMSELVRRAVSAHGTKVATHTPSLYSWT